MKIKKHITLGLILALISTSLFAQKNNDLLGLRTAFSINEGINKNLFEPNLSSKEFTLYKPSLNSNKISTSDIGAFENNLSLKRQFSDKDYSLMKDQNVMIYNQSSSLLRESDDKDFFLNNRRNRYSSLWAFASLNYVYADLVGLMDKNVLNQYQLGTVNGVNITPSFLTVAAGFMQVPLANVFLPQVIKNERTLRWVQIASGTIMTLVQSGTLFVGKPSPYYLLFSAIEIGTTAYITIDAIKWKPKKKIKTFE